MPSKICRGPKTLRMSSTSVPLVGIADAAAAPLPLLGPKKNAIGGAPIEYCLEVIFVP